MTSKLILVVLIMVVGLIRCAAKDTPKPTSDPKPGNVSLIVTTYDSLVYSIEEKPTAYNEADRLGIWYPASDFEPVGLYLSPGDSIEVDVKNLAGNAQPKLLVGTYSRYKASDKPTEYQLTAGVNTVSDSTGGLLYLKYVTEDTPSGEVELTFNDFSGGLEEPYSGKAVNLIDDPNFHGDKQG